MNFPAWLARWLGLETVDSIDSIEPSLAAPWAHPSPVWVIFGALLCAGLAALFYARWQPRKRRGARLLLGLLRGTLLVLLLLILADPVLTIKSTSRPKPLLWVLFDRTDSMNIEDDLPAEERRKLDAALPTSEQPSLAAPEGATPANSGQRPSRMDYVRRLVLKDKDNLLAKLDQKFRLQAFVLDHADRVRQIELQDPGAEKLDLPGIAEQLAAPDGQVTALGRALEDLAARHATSNLAGLVMISDFGHNAGPAPAGGDQSPAARLNVPVYTVGVGPETAVNLAVDLQAPLVMKKGERSTLVATVRQKGLEGRRATLKITGRRVDGDGEQTLTVGERDVELAGASIQEDFTVTPDQAGKFEFVAEIEPLAEERIGQDNRISRRVDIRDNFLRVLFVEHEPTWEWRFIKEVFHRDKLVGQRGFRTYLRSADPRVRKTNELFWDNLYPQRSDFFANDVVIIGDVPRKALNDSFCEMTRDFVGKFGGGLIVVAGPRFGPAQAADTPLADMLPVVVDAGAQFNDDREFQLQRTSLAGAYDFMQLGGKQREGAPGSDSENEKAWKNLGPLPWYQPVLRPHKFAAVLAEHPTAKCADGQTPQPIIAIRPYGRGEVVYVGFNETWRLRRRYGELYYRQFWAQMIHRLGLSHAVGAQKRFVLRTDQQQYKPDDRVILTVEAYTKNFTPLTEEDVADRTLIGELILPGRSDEEGERRAISVPMLREGVFEARIPVLAGGEHRLRVRDPVTGESSEVSFQVANLSAERRSAERNVAIEQQIAAAHGGRMYDLATADRLADEIDLKPTPETTVRVFPLWSTWLCFGVIVVLMLTEWLVRKVVNLP